MYGGEEATATRILASLVTPLIIGDIMEIAEEAGWGMVGAVAPLGFFGLSVYTLPSKRGTGNADIDEEMYKRGVFINQVGDTLSEGGVQIDLTTEEQEEYQSKATKYISQLVERLFQTPRYRGLSNTQKEQEIRKSVDEGRRKARTEMKAKLAQKFQRARMAQMSGGMRGTQGAAQQPMAPTPVGVGAQAGVTEARPTGKFRELYPELFE
jgi:hypothetical protein